MGQAPSSYIPFGHYAVGSDPGGYAPTQEAPACKTLISTNLMFIPAGIQLSSILGGNDRFSGLRFQTLTRFTSNRTALPRDCMVFRERFRFNCNGIDWMMRNSCSVLATSVRRFLPSVAVIFNCTISSYSWVAPSAYILRLRSLQYRRGLSASASAPTTSTTENSHSSRVSSHAVRMR